MKHLHHTVLHLKVHVNVILQAQVNATTISWLQIGHARVLIMIKIW